MYCVSFGAGKRVQDDLVHERVVLKSGALCV